MIDLDRLDEIDALSDNLNEAGLGASTAIKGNLANIEFKYQDDLLTTMLITANVGTIFEEVSIGFIGSLPI